MWIFQMLCFMCFVTTKSFGFLQPKSHVRQSSMKLYTSLDNEGAARAAVSNTLFVSEPVSGLDAPPPPPDTSGGVESLLSRLLAEGKPGTPGLPVFLSDPGSAVEKMSSQLSSIVSNPSPVVDKLSATVNNWAYLFRSGLDRSWDTVGASARESTKETATVLAAAAVDSARYFVTELGIGWEEQSGAREAVLEQARLVATSLVGLVPYIGVNAAASWEQNAPLREEATIKAAKVVPFVERSLSYFATNAAISWQDTGVAWRDDIVQTTVSSAKGFGPYFMQELGYSWLDSAPYRPIFASLLLGTVVALQYRQEKVKSVEGVVKKKTLPQMSSNPFGSPLLNNSMRNAQALVDRTASKIPVTSFQSYFLTTTAFGPKGKKAMKKPEKVSSGAMKQAMVPKKQASTQKRGPSPKKKASSAKKQTSPKKQSFPAKTQRLFGLK